MQDASDTAPVGPLLLAATSVAMSARTGKLNFAQVVALTEAAEQAEPGHPLRFAAQMFREGYDANWRDPKAIEALGEGLDRDIARVLRPEPVDLSRRDIHG